ncbi:MAG TPA: hypothetical protein VF764_01350, partial [Steroidobacteraceae bacterium]
GYRDSGPRQPLMTAIGVDLCKEVIGLNDRQQWSFNGIADWLETHTKPVALYELLSGAGRSRADVKRQFTLEPAIRDKWISALRSGRYSQLYGTWHHYDRVCTVEVILHELGYRDCGPRQPLMMLIGVDLCKEVICLNDQLQWSFNGIADWLATHTKPVSRAAAW